MAIGGYRFRRSFGNVASRFRGARFDTYPVFTGILDDYPGAAAAYSLRALSAAWLAGDVVEVRRSSDSTTQSFTASQIDSGAMLDFVNGDVIIYTSNFSTDDGWTSLNGVLTSNESIGGESPVAKLTVDSSSSVRRIQRTFMTSGVTYRITGEFYIPSTNDNITSIEIRDSSANLLKVLPNPTTDTWTAFSVEGQVGSSTLQIRAVGGTDVGADDYFAVQSIVATQILADGFVSTWYDQSGNGNDATQATTTSQPKIVSAGALVTDAGGKPWIDFQNAAGGNIGLDLASNIRETNGASSIFASIKFDQIFTGTTEYQNPIFLYDTQRWLVGSTTGPVDYKDICISDAGGATGDFRYVRFTATPTNHNLLTSIYDGSSTTGGGKPDIQFNENSAAKVGTDGSTGFGVPATGNNSIGYKIDTNNQGCDAKFQEIIIYDSDQSANRTGIETNINNYYSIY